mmetsp:Transcript_11417/g.18364  ORF Transcript_11417/g.18364 Transcript_11417/m.18364 type:complete len:536 (+) Transcript_11417:169-1776(+)
MSNMNGFGMNFGGMGPSGDMAPTGADYGPGASSLQEEMMFANSMNNQAAAMGGMFGGPPFPMGSMGAHQGMDDHSARMMNQMNMAAGNGPNMNMNMNMNMNSQFVPDLDMMALFRAKQSMMNRGRGGSAVQDKMLAFTQEQYAKGQGLPMSARSGGMDGLPLSTFLDGNAAGAGLSGMKRSVEAEPQMISNKKSKGDEKDLKAGKRRKKAKKSDDMPRRALSAYNIFFSEQRELILKEIDEKEKEGTKEEDAKDKTEVQDEAKEEDKDESEAENKEEEKDGSPKTKTEDEEPKDKSDDEKPEDTKDGDKDKTEDKKEKEGEDGKLPKVLNRSFFPKRAKRAHRKVHGKIGLVDLAREVSKRWKELDPESRKHYQDLAEEDRKRHKEVMAEYQERKAAENMVSMGAKESDDEEGAAAPSDSFADSSEGKLQGQKSPSEQDMRDSMAHQYQQRILAEMMAARRPAQEQMSMMNNFPPMMSRGGFQSDMHSMQNLNGMQDMNAMLELQNQRALMLQRMRMSGMGMDGMGSMGGMGPSM